MLLPQQVEKAGKIVLVEELPFKVRSFFTAIALALPAQTSEAMAKKSIRKTDALNYHQHPIPGKIEVVPSKSSKTQRDLALAYSPGVAEPCLAIAEKPEDVYKYTAKGNLVAVISNGSAVLGLGDLGPEASKPVMEGKGILFKIFAGIDVFDLEISPTNVDEFVQVVKALEPTFGGINLEDIKAPECFEIERRLKEEMSIPVMHDDQHGTAIITGAALLNALELVDKKIENLRVVVSGAGASAISCLRTFVQLGVRQNNILVADSKGIIHAERDNLSEEKKQFVRDTPHRTLADALKDADVFLGLSKADVMSAKMLKSMATDPIVFALANPDPEIAYDLAIATRSDVLMATGRSDYPNQVNNVLGFPFIFRGALDVRARAINEEMKLAAIKAIAALARKQVPEVVTRAYNTEALSFGRKYLIPKPLDPRLLTTVAPAVAKAAMASGVAGRDITDWDAYKLELKKRMGGDSRALRYLNNRAKQAPKRVAFAEAEDPRVLKAAQIALDEGIAKPILIGEEAVVKQLIAEHKLELSNVPIIDPRSAASAQQRTDFSETLFNKLQRKGYSRYEAEQELRKKTWFGCMLVESGQADALLSGITRNYAEVIRPALKIIGTAPNVQRVVSMYMMLTKKGPLFFADTTMLTEPTAEELAEIGYLAARSVKEDFGMEPSVAMLSYSMFGSSNEAEPKKVRKAVQLLKERAPQLNVDGEIQANFVFNTEALKENYPFTSLIDKPANVLVFPNLASGNIAYKLMQEMANMEAVGPILLGLKKPVHILQMGSSVREIVNMVAIATADAQRKDK